MTKVTCIVVHVIAESCSVNLCRSLLWDFYIHFYIGMIIGHMCDILCSFDVILWWFSVLLQDITPILTSMITPYTHHTSISHPYHITHHHIHITAISHPHHIYITSTFDLIHITSHPYHIISSTSYPHPHVTILLQMLCLSRHVFLAYSSCRIISSVTIDVHVAWSALSLQMYPM